MEDPHHRSVSPSLISSRLRVCLVGCSRRSEQTKAGCSASLFLHARQAGGDLLINIKFSVCVISFFHLYLSIRSQRKTEGELLISDSLIMSVQVTQGRVLFVRSEVRRFFFLSPTGSHLLKQYTNSSLSCGLLLTKRLSVTLLSISSKKLCSRSRGIDSSL